MNTIIDAPTSRIPTLRDDDGPRGRCAPTQPGVPLDVVSVTTVRFCPDCGAPVQIASRDAVVACAGCGTIHGARRFAPSWEERRQMTVRRVRRGKEQDAVWAAVRDALALVASWWDPNAYGYVRGFFAVRGWA